MSNVCRCCGAQLDGSKCGYCGFVEIIDMDGSGTELVSKMATTHKQRIVSNLTDLSVVSYNYKWNEAQSRLELDKKETIKLADGIECFLKPKISKYQFGQFQAGQDVTIEMHYKYRGESKIVFMKVPTIQCNDFWRIGVLINEQLNLQVFLGTSEQYSQSRPQCLELE